MGAQNVKPIYVPIAQTFILALGAVGTFIVGKMPRIIRGFVRPTLYDTPFVRQELSVTESPARPDYLQLGWTLLFLSFLGQIAWVWVDWLSN